MSKEITFSASQLEAIRCEDRICEVVAGPGSGKTTVLTQHILFLVLKKRISPSNILVLTFSRAAALQMRRRFYREAGEAGAEEYASLVTFGTFHAFFYGILKENTRDRAKLIGAKERSAILKALSAEYFPEEADRPLPEEIEAFLSWRSRSSERKNTQDGSMEQLASSYRKYLEENSFLDFDMVLTKTEQILRSRPETVKRLRERYSCIIADEMQDIDGLQYSMLKMIADSGMLFAVGDDDQSIYGFRGSDPRFMRVFVQDHPGCRVIHLGENYRCASVITEASLRVIAQNKNRIPKEIRAVRSGGEVLMLPCVNDTEETYCALDLLKDIMHEGKSSVAVIFRTNKQVYSFRKEAERAFPGQINSGREIPDDPEVRKLQREITEDLSAYSALSQGISDGRILRKDLLRILNRPPRYLLRSCAGEESIVFPETLLEKLSENPEAQNALRELFRDLRNLSSMSPAFFCRYLLECMGYRNFINAGRSPACELLLDKLVKFSTAHSSVNDWIGSWNDKKPAEASAPGESGKLQIMTMHACKGLEFDTVILPGLNEGLIPSRRSRTQDELEEERRLLYVAMTRAKNRLILLFSVGTVQNPRLPSRFLIPLGVRMQGLNQKGKYGKIFRPGRK